MGEAMTDDDQRLDRYLVSNGMAASRRVARDLIEAGMVRVNGSPSRKSELVHSGDRVELDSRPVAAALTADPSIVLEILYVDPSVVVVNKPGMMPCHPMRPGETGTVMNGLAAAMPETAAVGVDPREGGLIHRLDNGTSGALMIARNGDSFGLLRAAIRGGGIRRRYQALVSGRMEQATEIDVAISHDRRRSHRMLSRSGGRMSGVRPPRAASTHAVPTRWFNGMTLVDVYPSTGLRHQIRVHLASIEHPIVGDELYGGELSPAEPTRALRAGRFWLHLTEIEFESPAAGGVAVTAPLPDELARLLN